MSANLFFASPGQKDGPCLDTGCRHEVCKDIRAAAESECARCDQPIGYRTAFCADTDPKKPGVLVHVRCLRAADQWRSRAWASL